MPFFLLLYLLLSFKSLTYWSRWGNNMLFSEVKWSLLLSLLLQNPSRRTKMCYCMIETSSVPLSLSAAIFVNFSKMFGNDCLAFGILKKNLRKILVKPPKSRYYCVILQKRVRVFHRGIQTRENWWKHEAVGRVLLLFSSVWKPRWNTSHEFLK